MHDRGAQRRRGLPTHGGLLGPSLPWNRQLTKPRASAKQPQRKAGSTCLRAFDHGNARGGFRACVWLVISLSLPTYTEGCVRSLAAAALRQRRGSRNWQRLPRQRTLPPWFRSRARFLRLGPYWRLLPTNVRNRARLCSKALGLWACAQVHRHKACMIQTCTRSDNKTCCNMDIHSIPHKCPDNIYSTTTSNSVQEPCY